LTLPQLSRVVHTYCANVHDPTLASAIQTMCSRSQVLVAGDRVAGQDVFVEEGVDLGEEGRAEIGLSSYLNVLPEIAVRLMKDCPSEAVAMKRDLIIATRQALRTQAVAGSRGR
jgi:hypothetical protein